VKLARFRKPKVSCSPPYVEYRPNTNAVILMDMGHTPSEAIYGRDREREGN
jgi:hypothetical protein